MASHLWSIVTVLCSFNLLLEATDKGVPLEKSRTCVIGAGYSGLATARYLQRYGMEFTVFEATRHIGGTWRFDPHVGQDEDGLPLFTSMYKYLRTNTPRQTMEYPDFPFPDNTPSYITGTCFYKYLKSFANHFDLVKNIQFRSLVTSIIWAKDHWNLTITRTDKRDSETEVCDYVVVATGYFSKAKWPKFEGQDTFKGSMIHSHDYKEPEAYANRRVLVLGAGPSGLDLATHLVNFTSKLVHSHHLVYNQPDFPSNYVKKPDIKAFTPDGVVFQDGSFEEVDDVIFCTGFEYDHPFLSKSTGITATKKYLLPLYQHTVNIRHPSMILVGVSKGVINRVLDVQAEYAAALIAKKFELPPQAAMLKDWLDHVYDLRSRGKKIIDVNLIGDSMDQYFENITRTTGIPRVPKVLSDIRDFNAKNRLEDLLNYRNYDYEIADDHFTRKYNPRSEEVCPVNV